jgi:hypothetical protein
MDGPAHYRKAEELAAKAQEYLGQGNGQESAAVWAAVALVHATLALTAATALGTHDRKWPEVVGAEPSRERPERDSWSGGADSDMEGRVAYSDVGDPSDPGASY